MEGIVSTETAGLLKQLFNKEISIDDPRLNGFRQDLERFKETTPIGTSTEQQQQHLDSESQLVRNPRVQYYDYFGDSSESFSESSRLSSTTSIGNSMQQQQQQDVQYYDYSGDSHSSAESSVTSSSQTSTLSSGTSAGEIEDPESTARLALETPEPEPSTSNDIQMVFIKQEPNESNNDKDGPVMRVITCKKEIGSIKIKPEPTEYQYDVTVPMDRTTLKSEPATSTSTTTTTTIPIVCTTLKPEPTTTTTTSTSTSTTIPQSRPNALLIPSEQCFEVEDSPTRVVPTLSEICELQLLKKVAEMKTPNYQSTPSDQMLLLNLLNTFGHPALDTSSTTTTGMSTQQLSSVPQLPTTGLTTPFQQSVTRQQQVTPLTVRIPLPTTGLYGPTTHLQQATTSSDQLSGLLKVVSGATTTTTNVLPSTVFTSGLSSVNPSIGFATPQNPPQQDIKTMLLNFINILQLSGHASQMTNARTNTLIAQMTEKQQQQLLTSTTTTTLGTTSGQRTNNGQPYWLQQAPPLPPIHQQMCSLVRSETSAFLPYSSLAAQAQSTSGQSPMEELLALQAQLNRKRSFDLTVHSGPVPGSDDGPIAKRPPYDQIVRPQPMIPIPQMMFGTVGGLNNIPQVPYGSQMMYPWTY